MTGAVLCLSVQEAGAQALVHLNRTVWGCFNPAMVVALNDEANPKLQDPEWVSRTSDLGQCVTISSRSLWEALTGDRGGLTYVAYRGNVGRPGSFWVPTSAIVFPVREAPPSALDPAPAEPPSADTLRVAPAPVIEQPASPPTAKTPAPTPPEPELPPLREKAPSPFAGYLRQAPHAADPGSTPGIDLGLLARATITVLAFCWFGAWLTERRKSKR